MNKKEACEFLNCSPRTLENHVKRGRLSVSYKPGKHGQEAEYVESELQDLKESLALVAEGTSALVPVSSAQFFEQFRAGVMEFRTSVTLSEKLTLSIPEASALSGLTEGYLRKAIHAGTLKAGKRGPGGSWNIKRTDLNAFIETL